MRQLRLPPRQPHARLQTLLGTPPPKAPLEGPRVQSEMERKAEISSQKAVSRACNAIPMKPPDTYIWITRWSDFQHYKPNPDRGPAWIKTHTAQLSDTRYLELGNRERALLHDLRMMFASMRARLPHDRSMIGALRNTETRQASLDALRNAGLIDVVSRETLEHSLEKLYSRSRAEVEVELEEDKPPYPNPVVDVAPNGSHALELVDPEDRERILKGEGVLHDLGAL